MLSDGHSSSVVGSERCWLIEIYHCIALPGTEYPSKIISKLQGQSTVTLTLSTYSHMIDPMGAVAADVMDEIVGQ